MPLPIPEPRWYVCERPGCPYAGQPRPIMPTHLGGGFVTWPAAVQCVCSPSGFDCRLVPAAPQPVTSPKDPS